MDAVMRWVASRLVASRGAAHRSRLAALSVAAIDARVAANAEKILRFVIHGQAGHGIAFAGDAFLPAGIGAHIPALAAGTPADELSGAAAAGRALVVRAATDPTSVDHATGIERRAARIAAHMARLSAAEPVATLPVAANRLLTPTAQHARIATDAVLTNLVPLAT